MNSTLRDEEAAALMQDLLDGTLQGQDAQRAEAALLASPAHARQWQGQQALQARLRGLKAPEVPAGFEARLAARLAAQPKGLAGLWERIVEHWRVPAVVGLALAAGVGLLVTSPPATTAGSNGVGAAAVLGSRLPVEVTLRLRAPLDAWPQVSAALGRAGVVLPAPAEGSVVAFVTVEDPALVRRAVAELGALSSVETVGVLPSSGGPVQVRIQLLTP